jgi:predicted anti-sigma-YlaC factor YlaD
MTCEQIRDRLDEYVDGDLAEAEFQEVELHLGGCLECRQEERALRALIARAEALPEEMRPAQDLWPDIAARLRGPEGMRLAARTGIARWMGPMSLAAAAAVVIALSAALWTRGNVPGGAPLAPQGSVQPVALGASSVLLDSERDYARATADLMAAIESQKETLAPETRAVLDANLKTIDDALAQVRAALIKDPGNSQLAHLLTSTHQKKVDALKRVVRLNRT